MSQNKEVVRQRKIMNLISGIGASRRITRAHFIALESLEPGLVSEDMICEDRPADADDSELAKELVGSLESMRTFAIGGALIALIGMIIAFFKKRGGGGGSGGGGSIEVKTTGDVGRVMARLANADHGNREAFTKISEDIKDALKQLHHINEPTAALANKALDDLGDIMTPDRRARLMNSAVVLSSYFFSGAAGGMGYCSDLIRHRAKPVLYNCLIASNASHQQQWMHDAIVMFQGIVGGFMNVLKVASETLQELEAGKITPEQLNEAMGNAMSATGLGDSAGEKLFKQGLALYPNLPQEMPEDPVEGIELMKRLFTEGFQINDIIVDAKLQQIRDSHDFNILWARFGETAVLARKLGEDAERNNHDLEVYLNAINVTIEKLMDNKELPEEVRHAVKVELEPELRMVTGILKGFLQVCMTMYQKMDKIVVATDHMVKDIEKLPAFVEKFKAALKSDKVQI